MKTNEYLQKTINLMGLFELMYNRKPTANEFLTLCSTPEIEDKIKQLGEQLKPLFKF